MQLGREDGERADSRKAKLHVEKKVSSRRDLTRIKRYKRVNKGDKRVNKRVKGEGRR